MANTGTVTLTSSTSSIGYGAIPSLTVGQVYTTTGTGASNWANPSTQFNNSNGKPIMTVPAGTEAAESSARRRRKRCNVDCERQGCYK